MRGLDDWLTNDPRDDERPPTCEDCQDDEHLECRDEACWCCGGMNGWSQERRRGRGGRLFLDGGIWGVKSLGFGP